MEKTEIVILLFTVVEMTLSISIGLFLLLVRFKKLPYLGLFLIVYGISFLSETLAFFDSINQFPALSFLPFSFAFLHTSLLYAYVNSRLIQGRKKLGKKFVLFGIISCIIGLSIVLFPTDRQILIMNDGPYRWYWHLSIVYFFVTYIFSSVQIIKHNKLIKEQYSSIKNRELTAVFYFLVFAVLFLGTSIPLLYWLKVSTPYRVLLLTIFNMIWVMGMAYTGLFHQGSINLFKKEVKNIGDSKFKPKKEKNHSNNKDIKKKINLEELFESIQITVDKKQLFLNPELTITDVANAVNRHPRLVSQTINSESGKNFSAYINFHRIQYAQKLLLSQEGDHFSIEGLGRMAGFKSNSAFYTAFKKRYSCTPAQYQKQHIT